MDFKLEDRDLNKSGLLIDGLLAKKQNIMIRLITERGSFIYDERLGSRLKLLLREKPSDWNDKAMLYVLEALEDEKDVDILEVVVSRKNKTQISIYILFKWLDLQDSLEVIV